MLPTLFEFEEFLPDEVEELREDVGEFMLRQGFACGPLEMRELRFRDVDLREETRAAASVRAAVLGIAECLRMIVRVGLMVVWFLMRAGACLGFVLEFVEVAVAIFKAVGFLRINREDVSVDIYEVFAQNFYHHALVFEGEQVLRWRRDRRL